MHYDQYRDMSGLQLFISHTRPVPSLHLYHCSALNYRLQTIEPETPYPNKDVTVLVDACNKGYSVTMVFFTVVHSGKGAGCSFAPQFTINPLTPRYSITTTLLSRLGRKEDDIIPFDDPGVGL